MASFSQSTGKDADFDTIIDDIADLGDTIRDVGDVAVPGAWNSGCRHCSARSFPTYEQVAIIYTRPVSTVVPKKAPGSGRMAARAIGAEVAN